jgi:DnaJ-class molecular chaperone
MAIEFKRFETCPYCGGEGHSEEFEYPFAGCPPFAVAVKCDECNGSGWVDEYGTPPGVAHDLPRGCDPMRGVEFPFAENH